MKQLYRLVWFFSGLMSSHVLAQQEPEIFSLVQFNYSGTGCPAGTAVGALSEDGESFTLLFSDFVASSGAAVSPTESRKNCALEMTFEVPDGWAFAITDIDFRGYAALESKVRGLQKSEYFFSGERHLHGKNVHLKGPFADDYLHRVSRDKGLAWSSCDRKIVFNIRTQVSLEDPKKQGGLLTVDSIDGQMSHRYGIEWKRCRGGPGRNGHPKPRRACNTRKGCSR